MANEVVVWCLISGAVALILSSISLSIIKGRSNRRHGVAFFHPYTNDGGGGERVLWCAVKAIQEESSDLDCVIYTGDHDASPDSLMARAVQRFGVELLYPPKVLPLSLKYIYFFSVVWVYSEISFCLVWFLWLTLDRSGDFCIENCFLWVSAQRGIFLRILLQWFEFKTPQEKKGIKFRKIGDWVCFNLQEDTRNGVIFVPICSFSMWVVLIFYTNIIHL